MTTEGQFFLFLIKPYVVTPHLTHLDKTVQMRGHNICLLGRINKKNSVECLPALCHKIEVYLKSSSFLRNKS